MAKPSEAITWAEGGAAVDPGAGIKDTGWLGGNQPPAEFMNYILMFLGRWSQYLNELESTEVLTWALSQIFDRGITLGNNWAASETEAISPRLTAEPVSSSVADYTLLLKSKDARLWAEGVGSDSALVVTVNATRTTDGADKWTKITSSQPAFALFVSRAGVSLAYMPAAQNTAWAGAFVEGEGTTSGWGRLFFFPSVQGAATNAQQDVSLINNVVNGTSNRRLLWTIKPTSSARGVRLYYMRTGGPNGSDGLEIVVNATWSNADQLWAYDTTNRVYKWSFSISEMVTQWKVSGTAGTTYDDNSWTGAPFDVVFPTATSGATDHTKAEINNGHIKVVNTKSDDEDDANPPAQSGQANKIGVRNVNKVTAYITSGTSPALVSGYNVATSTPITTSASKLTLNFETDLADANYEATVTVQKNDTSNGYWAHVTAKAAGSITVAVFKAAVGGAISLVDLGSNSDQVGIDIHVTGKQTT